MKEKFRSPLEFVNGAKEEPTNNHEQQITTKSIILPWQDAHPKVKEHFVVRMPERLHKQLSYLSQNSCDSMHTIALLAIEAEVKQRLKSMGIDDDMI